MLGLKPFLTRRAYEYMLHSWMVCVRYFFSAATFDDAIKSFRKRFKIEEEELKTSNAIKIWEKLDEDFEDFRAGEEEIKGDQRLKTHS